MSADSSKTLYKHAHRSSCSRACLPARQISSKSVSEREDTFSTIFRQTHCANCMRPKRHRARRGNETTINMSRCWMRRRTRCVCLSCMSMTRPGIHTPGNDPSVANVATSTNIHFMFISHRGCSHELFDIGAGSGIRGNKSGNFDFIIA